MSSNEWDESPAPSHYVPPLKSTDPMSPHLCQAHSKQTGKQCKRTPISGGSVCRYHGGMAPQVRAKAEGRLIMQRSEALLAKLGEDVKPVTDPYSALENLAGQMMTLLDLLRSEVSKLNQVGSSSKLGLEQVKAELQVYTSTAARAESVLKGIISLDLEGRRVRIQEVQVMRIITAINQAMDDAHLTSDQKNLMRRLLSDSFLGRSNPGDKAVTQGRDQGEQSRHLTISQTVTE